MCLCTAPQAEAQHSKTSWHAVSRVFRYIHPEVNATHYCADTQTNTANYICLDDTNFPSLLFHPPSHLFLGASLSTTRQNTLSSFPCVYLNIPLLSLLPDISFSSLSLSFSQGKTQRLTVTERQLCMCLCGWMHQRALNRKWFVDINNSPLSLPTVTLHGTHSTLNYSVFSLIQIQNPLHALASAVPAPKTLSTLQWSSRLKSHIGRINSDNKYEHTLTCFKQMRLFSLSSFPTFNKVV